MATFLTSAILGAFISLIGIINMMGNISTIHRYHRSRVTEECRRPFGKLVGLGTLIIGIACIMFGVLFRIYEITQAIAFNILGVILLLSGLAVGLAVSFYAMKKYNGGVF